MLSTNVFRALRELLPESPLLVATVPLVGVVTPSNRAPSSVAITVLRSVPMGSSRAWLPSRKSTLHHTGGLEMTRLGHCRAANATGSKA